MNIAQISATFPPYMGGTGNVCFNYSIGLAKLGHNITVVTSKNTTHYSYPISISVKSYTPVLRIGNAPLIPQIIKLKNFDIIHLHYPFFFGDGLTYLNHKINKLKYILTYHNDVIFNNYLRYFMLFYNATITQKLLFNAEKICVTSLDYAINSNLCNWVSPERFIEIPNGVDIKRFNPNINLSVFKHNFDGFEIILFVGALDRPHYFKGIEYLLRAFSTLNRKKTLLLIVGDGNLKQYYMKLSESLGILNHTVFLGKVTDEDLPYYYALSDIFVLPSINAGEAFGMVLLEAMACGIPVIASNLPGIRKVVDDGVNGLLVIPKNVPDLALKIDFLLENEKIRKDFGKSGRQKVEAQYAWEKIIRKLERLYSTV